MKRRGFLQSLAALIGAKVVADKLPPDEPTPEVVAPITSGLIQHTPLDLNGMSWTITTNAATGTMVWYDPSTGAWLQGNDWSYTANSARPSL